jgi:hypothetical protein
MGSLIWVLSNLMQSQQNEIPDFHGYCPPIREAMVFAATQPLDHAC